MPPDSIALRWTSGPTVGEMLLLSALRQWAALRSAGQHPSRLVAQTLAFRSSDRTGGLFVAWMQAVEAGLRRPIEVECPACGGISTDEQRLMASCGLAGAATAVGETLLEPLLIDTSADRDTALAEAEADLKARGIVQTGDVYAITCGEPMGSPGGTNMIKICRVG